MLTPFAPALLACTYKYFFLTTDFNKLHSTGPERILYCYRYKCFSSHIDFGHTALVLRGIKVIRTAHTIRDRVLSQSATRRITSDLLDC